jgi:hypothetical protein
MVMMSQGGAYKDSTEAQSQFVELFKTHPLLSQRKGLPDKPLKAQINGFTRCGCIFGMNQLPSYYTIIV